MAVHLVNIRGKIEVIRSEYRHILYYTHGCAMTGDHRPRRRGLRNAPSIAARPWAQPDQCPGGFASSSAVYSDRVQPAVWKTINPIEMAKGSAGKRGVTRPNLRRSARQQPPEAADTREGQPAT